MTSQTFSALSLDQKRALILQEGQCLTSVRYYKLSASLYVFQNFFVEVLSDPDSQGFQQVHLATDEKMLKYLNQIDVNGVIN